MIEKGISIIVCCYNSESRLPKTLEYLAKQKMRKDIPVELLIVNNASTDRTKEIAQKVWARYHTRFLFRVVDEEKPGHMFARRKGVQESKYEYILFCDDDNWLQRDYLQKAFDLMESNSRIGALGGQSIAVSDVDFPEWFSDFKAGYAVGTQSDNSGDVSKRGYLWGAGMITRKALLDTVFNEKCPPLIEGRTGNKLISGDDSEISKRILLLGYTLHYDSNLLFYHYMSPHRLTWAYKKNLYEGFVTSWDVLRKYDVVYNEMGKNFMRKMKGIVSHGLKILTPGNSKNHLKDELYVKMGLAFKSTNIVNDLTYKNITAYHLQSGQKSNIHNKNTYKSIHPVQFGVDNINKKESSGKNIGNLAVDSRTKRFHSLFGRNMA